MTADKRAPREWYLCDGATYPCEDFTLEQVTAKDGEYCDTLVAVVVEKPAFTALKADAEKLAAALTRVLIIAQKYEPPEVHRGACGPNAGCDLNCIENYYDSKHLEEANAALAEWRAKWGGLSGNFSDSCP